MIICSCNKVTDKDIIKCIRSGGESLSDIMFITKAATECGGCFDSLSKILDDYIKNHLGERSQDSSED